MLKFLLEQFVVIIICLILLTQVILPAFITKLKYFWFFKEDPFRPEPPPTPIFDKEKLAQRINEVKQKADEVRKEADERYKKSRDTKDLADNI